MKLSETFLILITATTLMVACSDDESSEAAGPSESMDDSGSVVNPDAQSMDSGEPWDSPSTDTSLEVSDTSALVDALSDAILEDTATATDIVGDTTDAGLNPEDAVGDTLADTDAAAEDTGPPLADTSDTFDAQEPEVTEPDVTEPDVTEPDVTEPDAPPPPPADLYLLSVDNSSHTLQKVDVTTGATTDVCQLNTTQTYPSLTFSRFNGLYGSRDGSQLDRIDPCTCTISPIGSYGAYSGIYGITADKSDNLFGVATVQDWLVSISTDNGTGTGLGALGYDFTTSGGTWSDADDTLYAINGGTNGLYTVDPILGTATLLSTLDYNFGTVGIELHPGNDVIYACSSAGHLLSVDPNGQVTDIGDMGQGGSCTNLAAPWLQVPCLDGI
jgi:hypothetical protein